MIAASWSLLMVVPLTSSAVVWAVIPVRASRLSETIAWAGRLVPGTRTTLAGTVQRACSVGSLLPSLGPASLFAVAWVKVRLS